MLELALAAIVALLLVALLLLGLLLGRSEQAPLRASVQALQTSQERGERALREELARGRQEAAASARGLREELSGALRASHDSLLALLDTRLGQIQADNAARLEEMRRTVDEKLQGTLEKRLGESFRAVSERLEQVHRGLGEMQTLAAGVGDLKKVLANVKARGTWGEVALGNLLEQTLAPEQYARNVATRAGSAERVEYAIRLPGRDGDGASPVWLPVDAKFPREDYERLVDAAERGDAAAVEESVRALEARVRAEAKDIRDKYLDPPATTDFGILFLPTEGLYAEVLRRPGLVDALQRELRVSVAGPTTLAALLNSLQMGFRTLAVQQRSAEVWKVLGGVKSEFARFGAVVDKVQKKLQEAGSAIEDAARRTRAMERRLRDVEALPAPEDAPGEVPAPALEDTGS